MQALSSVYHTIFSNPQTDSEAKRGTNWKKVAAVVGAVGLYILIMSAPVFTKENSGSEITSLVTSLRVSDASVSELHNATGICLPNSLSKEVAPYCSCIIE